MFVLSPVLVPRPAMSTLMSFLAISLNPLPCLSCHFLKRYSWNSFLSSSVFCLVVVVVVVSLGYILHPKRTDGRTRRKSDVAFTLKLSVTSFHGYYIVSFISLASSRGHGQRHLELCSGYVVLLRGVFDDEMGCESIDPSVYSFDFTPKPSRASLPCPFSHYSEPL